jgi:hypothetical protein
MNNIWFFGDSVTRGDGTLKGEPYHNPNKYSFPDLIANTIGYTCKNLGVNGGCPEWITHKVIETIPEIKEKDILVINPGAPRGFLNYLVSKGKVFSMNDAYLNNSSEYYNSVAEMRILHNYRGLRKKYENYYEELYIDQFNNLFKTLNRLGIYGVQWSYKEWLYKTDRYPNITKATKGAIKNIHLSYEGHEKMSNFILNLLYKQVPSLKKPLN